MAKFFFAVIAALLALTGCTGACDDCTDTDIVCCESDTDDVAYGDIEVHFNIDGVDEDCTYYVGETRYFSEDGPMPFEVGDYDLQFGNAKYAESTDGYYLHQSSDDRDWVSPDQVVNVKKNKVMTVEAPLNLYFFYEEVTCIMESYYYLDDEWHYDDTYTKGRGDLEVLKGGGQLSFTGQSSMSDDWFTEGSHIVSIEDRKRVTGQEVRANGVTWTEEPAEDPEDWDGMFTFTCE